MADTNNGTPEGLDPRALPIGTHVQEYEVLRFVEGGGFSLVYLARDLSLGRQVALKEYMPPMASRAPGATQVTPENSRDGEAFRSGLRRFINDARLLARFDQPALAKVHRFWEENGTAYMSMPFYEGTTVQKAVLDKRVPTEESALRQMLSPLMDALEALHEEQCYHRDICPDNILLTSNGRALLDFGVARTVITNASQSFHVVLKEGYAPAELYSREGAEASRQGPWTDIYALCAVMRYIITGTKPHSAVVRSARREDPLEPLTQAYAGRYSEPFLRAIDKGMAIVIDNRPQSIAQLRSILAEQPTVLLSKPSRIPPQLEDLWKRVSGAFDHPWARKAAIAAVLPVIVLGAFLGSHWGRSPTPRVPYTAVTAVQHSTPAAFSASRAASDQARAASDQDSGQHSAPVASHNADEAGQGEPAHNARSQAPRDLAPAADVDTPSGDESPAVANASASVAPPVTPPAVPDSSESSSSKSHSRSAHSGHSRSSESSKSRLAVVAPPPSVPPPGTPPVVQPSQPAVAPAAAVAPPPVVSPSSPPPQAESAPTSVEHDYTVNVRRIIQAATVVPDTPEYQAALHKAKGGAVVNFMLDRRGVVSHVAMGRPTGSDVLDKLVMRIVSNGRYPPFPANAWPDAIIRPFSVPFSFH